MSITNIHDAPDYVPMATESQRDYIRSLCEDIDEDPDAVVWQEFRKEMSDITAEEASDLIEELKVNKRKGRRY